MSGCARGHVHVVVCMSGSARGGVHVGECARRCVRVWGCVHVVVCTYGLSAHGRGGWLGAAPP